MYDIEYFAFLIISIVIAVWLAVPNVISAKDSIEMKQYCETNNMETVYIKNSDNNIIKMLCKDKDGNQFKINLGAKS